MPTESPDSEALADAAASLIGAYVHIPFCRRVCPYCDFAVVEGTDAADRYVDAVCGEIERAEPFARPVDAVAFGGGTPTSLPPPVLGRILDALGERFGIAPGAEVSIEANPEDLDPATARGIAALGFNRISLGVQSFDDRSLQSLGRAHSAELAGTAVAIAVDSFESVNVDLIFGTPGETPGSWESSVARALDAGIGHLSTYALTVERGTPLSRAVATGAPAPDPDLQADLYEAGAALAATAGLVRYETSNYAMPGEAVAYNLLTWAQGEYEAFGNGAHRHRRGIRSWNVRRVDRYVERLERGESPQSGLERLGPWERDVESVMLGLRRSAGVVLGVVGRRLLNSAAGRELVAAGVLGHDGDRLRVLRPLLGDEVARALLALDPSDC
ncbi:MAG: radical SAM family heme chaperone HemW [Acidimicrobiia bacterium]